MTTTGTIANALRKSTSGGQPAQRRPADAPRLTLPQTATPKSSLGRLPRGDTWASWRFALHYDDRRKYPGQCAKRPRLLSGTRATGCRQRFDIGRHRFAVGLTQLRRIAHDLHHGAADKVR